MGERNQSFLTPDSGGASARVELAFSRPLDVHSMKRRRASCLTEVRLTVAVTCVYYLGSCLYLHEANSAKTESVTRVLDIPAAGDATRQPRTERGSATKQLYYTAEDTYGVSRACMYFDPPHFIQYMDTKFNTPTRMCIVSMQKATIRPNGLVYRKQKNTYQRLTLGKWYFKKDKLLDSVSNARPLTKYHSYISFVHIWQDVFSHIAFDTIPRVQLLCSHLQRQRDIGILLTGKLQEQLFLQTCQIDTARFHYVSEELSAENISVSVFPGNFDMGILPPLSISSLGPQTKSGTKIVYIQRLSGKRSVTNEYEVLAVLRSVYQNTLEIYSPTDNWKVDRDVFANARVIIGPHGGAFGNMIFAPVNTTIVEFLPLLRLKQAGVNARPCYFGQAHGLGFTYHAFEIENFDFELPMFVPPNELKRFLTERIPPAVQV